MQNPNEIQFSIVEEEPMKTFEEEIAYFFGVSNKEPIVNSYIGALKKLEEIGSNCPKEKLEQELVPFLEEAYKEISAQRGWKFDAHQAALLELQIILGNASNASFESVQDLMTQLYALVFDSHSPNIRKAAQLRTFLYQYKVDVLKKEQKISQEDQKLMIVLAKASETYLNRIK